MICSSLPCHNLAQALEGLNKDPADNLAGTPQPFTDAELDALVRHGYGAGPDEDEDHPWMRARAAMVDSVLTGGSGGRGGTRDHRAFLITPGGVPVAVVNGAADVFCKLDVFDTLDYRNLWRGRVSRLEDSGHCPCWDQQVVFALLLGEFAADCFSRLSS